MHTPPPEGAPRTRSAQTDVTLNALTGGVIVSCQAAAGTPLARPDIIAALAQAAELGGAVGLRIEGIDDIRAVQRVTRLPLIGLIKVDYPGSPVRITPSSREITALCRTGVEIIATDATFRDRPAGSLKELIDQVRSESDALVMADVATLAEGERALELGADVVSTTLQGYTAPGELVEEPAFSLMAELVATGGYVVAEGRIQTRTDIRRCFDIGVGAVVVGTAITDPLAITRRLAAAAPRTPRSADDNPTDGNRSL